jgi:magnesium chelatase family protein
LIAKVLTCAVVGLDGALVEVEADIGMGLPAFTVVGLPDAGSARDAVGAQSAILKLGFGELGMRNSSFLILHC